MDFNHDTRLDIAETNGDSANSGSFFNEQSYLWIQDTDGSFDEMAQATGFDHHGKGRGMISFDFDNDGDQDVVLLANNERMHFYRNDIAGADANWVRVFLDTSDDPALAPRGVGARVTVTAGGVTQMRHISGGPSFLSYSELSAHFGLGPATTVDTLQVDWPDQTSTGPDGRFGKPDADDHGQRGARRRRR